MKSIATFFLYVVLAVVAFGLPAAVAWWAGSRALGDGVATLARVLYGVLALGMLPTLIVGVAAGLGMLGAAVGRPRQISP